MLLALGLAAGIYPVGTAPVEANELSYTMRDVCRFALRKVVGLTRPIRAGELDDALERLSDMLARWKAEGADLGVPLPCEADDVFEAEDAFVSAVKNNLIVEISDLYGFDPSPRVVMNARGGLQAIKMAKLPEEREGADYY